MPIDATTTYGYIAVVLNEAVSLELYMTIAMSFLTFYVSVCTYFRSFLDDLASIISEEPADSSQRISMKRKFVQFIELHLHVYE